MILSQSGPCPLCGSNTHDKSSPSGATSTDLKIETEAEIELPFGLAESDSVVDSNRLLFGLEDAPEDASEDAVLDIVETYEFAINGIIGNLINPFEFNVGKNGTEIYPAIEIAKSAIIHSLQFLETNPM